MARYRRGIFGFVHLSKEQKMKIRLKAIVFLIVFFVLFQANTVNANPAGSALNGGVSTEAALLVAAPSASVILIVAAFAGGAYIGYEIYKNKSFKIYADKERAETFLPSGYYEKESPSQTIPGEKIIVRYDYKGKIIQKKYYDQYGREEGWVDYTDHGHPREHTVPHWHEKVYDQQHSNGFYIHHRKDPKNPFEKNGSN